MKTERISAIADEKSLSGMYTFKDATIDIANVSIGRTNPSFEFSFFDRLCFKSMLKIDI